MSEPSHLPNETLLHSYHVQIILLPSGSSTESVPEAKTILVNHTSTFKEVKEKLAASLPDPDGWTLLTANYGPIPYWTEYTEDPKNSTIGATCQNLYAVNKNVPYVLGVVRTSEYDRPIAISLSSIPSTDKSSPPTIRELVVALADRGLQVGIESIGFYSGGGDVSYSYSQPEKKASTLPTFFIVNISTPPEKYHLDVKVDSIPPFLQILFVKSKHLLQHAYDLEKYPLQMIHVSSAFLHVVISLPGISKTSWTSSDLVNGIKKLRDTAIEHNSLGDVTNKESDPSVEDMLQVVLLVADKLQKLHDDLMKILTDIQNHRSKQITIQGEINRIFNDLCGDYPGAVTVRRSHRTFEKLAAIDREQIHRLEEEGRVSIRTETADSYASPSGAGRGFVRFFGSIFRRKKGNNMTPKIPVAGTSVRFEETSIVAVDSNASAHPRSTTGKNKNRAAFQNTSGAVASQPPHEGAIVFFDPESTIAEGPDLLRPLRAACVALRVVLQRAESIGHVNEDRKGLVNVLKIHLATVENHIANLEEDQEIDGIIPVLNQHVGESLETYARELKEIYTLLFDNQPKSSSLVRKITDVDHDQGIIAGKTHEVDEAFQRYTTALYQFAASTVNQMQFRQELQQEAEKAHTGAEKWHVDRYNAYGIQHRECLEGTREKTLSAISGWVDDENTEKWILFFLDVAGSGKSTIAKHMAEKWTRENRLLAQFFFSRNTTETMSTNSFCWTVASAFAALDPTYKDHTDKFMKLPNAGLLPFEGQFEGLVAGPLRAIGRHAILIIDALDECHPRQRGQLLQTLHVQHSSMPFLRILATGRPERDIKRWVEEEFGFSYMNFIRVGESDKDVELYIKHTLKVLPIAQHRLYPVIHRAEGLFIWARVACDLLLDCDDIDGLLEELAKEVSLDYLYKVALEQSMPKEGASRRAMIMVLQMILAAREPLSIAELEMLSPKRDVVERVVTRLGSVLLYQGREDPIRLLHATFREFLTARSKANIFFIQPELGHHTLASGCLNTISHLSKQNDATLRKLDRVSDRKIISFLAGYLLTMYTGLLFTRQSHGCIIVRCHTESWL